MFSAVCENTGRFPVDITGSNQDVCGKCPSNMRERLEHGEQIFDRVQSKKPNSSRSIPHACTLCLRTDVSRDTRCSRALNTQLPRVTAEHTMHHILVMDGQSFGQSK